MSFKNKFGLALALSLAATSLDAYSAQKLALSQLDRDEISEVLTFPANEGIKLIRAHKPSKNLQFERYQQTYHGIPIWGYHIIIKRDGKGKTLSLHGTKLLDLSKDESLRYSAIQETLHPKDVLHQIEKDYVLNHRKLKDLKFSNEMTDKFIYINDAGIAKLVVRVSFFASSMIDNFAERPHYIIDAHTGQTLESFDALTHERASGPGGNEKTGKYFYGQDFDALDVNVNAQGLHCMETTNVQTINLEHSRSGGEVFCFDSDENTYKEVNGAYSPLNDAHYFGNVVFNMYNDVVGTAPLNFQLKMRVHYGASYENAFGMDLR